MINGLGEMVKSGVIADRDLFRSIEKARSLNIQNLKPLIPQTCRIKARIVEEDERETNLRSDPKLRSYGGSCDRGLIKFQIESWQMRHSWDGCRRMDCVKARNIRRIRS